MNIAPESPTDLEVLDLIREEWLPEASSARYLPVGFGAHHWQIDANGEHVLFATFDVPGDLRTLELIECAYQSVSELSTRGFCGAVAPLQSRTRTFTVALANGVLSVTPWLDGRNPTAVEARGSRHLDKLIPLLTDLHACKPPETLPVWRPRVDPDFAESLNDRLADPWTNGPLGERARQMIRAALDVVVDANREYYLLAHQALAIRDRWVPTHGEPHWANQLIVGDELFLVDWDTVALGPAEIDFVDLPRSARESLSCDESLLRMFRLEWQLMEISEYADWFEREHSGSPDDAAAIEKLYRELRPV